MKPKITFWKLLEIWSIIALIMLIINGFILKISIIRNLILASLGIALLIYPVWPKQLEQKYSAEKCRFIMRVVAIIEILFAFSIKQHI